MVLHPILGIHIYIYNWCINPYYGLTTIPFDVKISYVSTMAHICPHMPISYIIVPQSFVRGASSHRTPSERYRDAAVFNLDMAILVSWANGSWLMLNGHLESRRYPLVI